MQWSPGIVPFLSEFQNLHFSLNEAIFYSNFVYPESDLEMAVPIHMISDTHMQWSPGIVPVLSEFQNLHFRLN